MQEIESDYSKDIILRIPKISKVHILLFMLTVFSTLLAGALMQGANVISNPISIPENEFAEIILKVSTASLLLPT